MMTEVFHWPPRLVFLPNRVKKGLPVWSISRPRTCSPRRSWWRRMKAFRWAKSFSSNPRCLLLQSPALSASWLCTRVLFWNTLMRLCWSVVAEMLLKESRLARLHSRRWKREDGTGQAVSVSSLPSSYRFWREHEVIQATWWINKYLHLNAITYHAFNK